MFFDFDFALANMGLGAMSLFSTLLVVLSFYVVHVYSERVGGLDVIAGKE